MYWINIAGILVNVTHFDTIRQIDKTIMFFSSRGYTTEITLQNEERAEIAFNQLELKLQIIKERQNE